MVEFFGLFVCTDSIDLKAFLMQETALDASVPAGEEPCFWCSNSGFCWGLILLPRISVFWSSCCTFHTVSGPKPLETDGKTPNDLSRLWITPPFRTAPPCIGCHSLLSFLAAQTTRSSEVCILLEDVLSTWNSIHPGH